MKLHKHLILLIFLCNATHAQIPPPVAQALARGGIPESAVGLYVHEVGANDPIAMHRAELPLNPASVMKLVTTYAALELLGPAHEWITEIHTDGTLQNDVLLGNLYIKGAGDPKLAIENVWLMLRKLRARGIREIRGDLVLDRGVFTTDHPDPGQFDNEPLQPYNTTPDALLTNFKSFTLTFTPDAETRSVRISADPPLQQLQIVNNLNYTEGACAFFANRVKPQTQDGGDTARVIYTGNYAQNCGEQVTYLSVMNHRGYFGALFRHVWRELGGSLNGRVRDGPVPGGAVRLIEQPSQPLSEIVRYVNKFSNNVMTRQLLLTLGAASGGPGTPERGTRAVQQLLAARGVPMPELVIENGSGLSRIERVSARGLGHMLLAAYRSPVMPEFISSMPLVGVDGTMHRRLRNTDVSGQAHIKTGLINDVRALGGYVLDQRGRRVVAVMLINHPRAFNANAVQDALLRWVHNREGADCCRRPGK